MPCARVYGTRVGYTATAVPARKQGGRTRLQAHLPALAHELWFRWHAALWRGGGAAEGAARARGIGLLGGAARTEAAAAVLGAGPAPIHARRLRALQLRLAARHMRGWCTPAGGALRGRAELAEAAALGALVAQAALAHAASLPAGAPRAEAGRLARWLADRTASLAGDDAGCASPPADAWAPGAYPHALGLCLNVHNASSRRTAPSVDALISAPDRMLCECSAAPPRPW